MSFTFVDLCAGIGGGRLGLEAVGFQCLGYAEIDTNAINTYQAIHGYIHENLGDLTLLDIDALPNVELLVAGFPCQTFSIVGKRQGLDDQRGQIIFAINNILKKRNIKYFILENVKGLVNINKGKTLENITQLLSNTGYHVYHKVLNSFDYGLPQLRERVYFVGIRSDLSHTSYKFPQENITKQYDLAKYLVDNSLELILKENTSKYNTFIRYLNNKYNLNKYNLESLMKEDYLVLDTRQSDLRLYRGRVPTLRTGRHGILYVREGELRHLSGKEALLLQGFSASLFEKIKNQSNTRLLSQAGNAMSVNVISAIAESLLPIIKANEEEI